MYFIYKKCLPPPFYGRFLRYTENPPKQEAIWWPQKIFQNVDGLYLSNFW